MSEGVASAHKDHTAAEADWTLVRDCIAGSRAVKEKKEAYIPRLEGLTPTEFAGYIDRASFFNATGRTHDAFVGLIMGSDPEVEIPPALKPLLENIDGAGFDLNDFIRRAVSEVLITGRGLALVDYPARPDDLITADQEQAAGVRPYAVWYTAESVLDWRVETINGRRETVFLKLNETAHRAKDEWTFEDVRQIRVCDLHDGAYRVRVFQQGDRTWELISEIVPRGATGGPLTAIPCAWFGATNGTPDVEKSPLRDLADLNIGHYRNSADREHAAHFTGLPQPYISGHSLGEDEEVRIGSTVVLAFPDPQARMGFASFGAEGLSALETLMGEKQNQMAALGARMMAREPGGAESAEALAIRRRGENSALAKLAASVGSSVEAIVLHMADWAGIDSKGLSISLNQDYIPSDLTAQDVQALLAAWQSGAVSHLSMFNTLKRGGVIGPDRMFDDERDDIARDAPAYAAPEAEDHDAESERRSV